MLCEKIYWFLYALLCVCYTASTFLGVSFPRRKISQYTYIIFSFFYVLVHFWYGKTLNNRFIQEENIEILRRKSLYMNVCTIHSQKPFDPLNWKYAHDILFHYVDHINFIRSIQKHNSCSYRGRITFFLLIIIIWYRTTTTTVTVALVLLFNINDIFSTIALLFIIVSFNWAYKAYRRDWRTIFNSTLIQLMFMQSNNNNNNCLLIREINQATFYNNHFACMFFHKRTLKFFFLNNNKRRHTDFIIVNYRCTCTRIPICKKKK